MRLPGQILRTGIDLKSNSISPNTRQLADSIELTPILEKIQRLRAQTTGSSGREVSLEALAAKQELQDSLISAYQLIQKTSLEVDFIVAEIEAEQNVYSEILNSYQQARDKHVAVSNATSFVTNGALWAIGEGLAIPTYHRPNYAISSGIFGIIAGVVPSFFSLWAMKLYDGKKSLSETNPNALAKLFDYPVSKEIDYPKSVWNFLSSIPADDKSGKSRKDQLINRWITDSNLPDFTDPQSTKQLDVITASVAHKRALTISSLTTRKVMLEQLTGEILKMKRMLLELSMVTSGEKAI